MDSIIKNERHQSGLGILLVNDLANRYIRKPGTCPIYMSKKTPIVGEEAALFKSGKIVITPNLYYNLSINNKKYADGSIILLTEEQELYRLKETNKGMRLDIFPSLGETELEIPNLNQQITELIDCVIEDYYHDALSNSALLEMTLDRISQERQILIKK